MVQDAAVAAVVVQAHIFGGGATRKPPTIDIAIKRSIVTIANNAPGHSEVLKINAAGKNCRAYILYRRRKP